MKSLYQLLLLCLFIGIISACEVFTPLSPQPDEVFTKFYGANRFQRGVDIKQTSDGGYILLGITNSFSINPTLASANDLYLVKTDNAGNEEWSKTYGTPDNEIAKKLLITNNGYIIASNRFVTKDTSKIWILKVDNTGTRQWSKVWRDTIPGKEVVNDISLTDKGTFLLTGSSSNINTNKPDTLAEDITDFFYAEIDSTGELLDSWITDEIGGFLGAEYGAGIRSTSSYIYILGSSNFPTESGFLFLIVQPNGNWLDYKKYKTDLVGLQSHSMQQTPTGEYLCMGIDPNDEVPRMVVQYINNDSQFSPGWNWISSSGKEETPGNLQIIPDGGYIISGSANNGEKKKDYYITRLDASGTPIWSKIFGSETDDIATNAIPTLDGGFAIIGTNQVDDNNSMMTLVKVNANGEQIPTIK